MPRAQDALPHLLLRCYIPKILSDSNVTIIALTGSSKTASFALPFGVYAIVLTPTNKLACQLIEQFCALSSLLNVRCTVVVGEMDMTGQARALVQQFYMVVATLGRIKVLLENDPGLPAMFSKTKVNFLK